MAKSESYELSECCGGVDCDYIDCLHNQPCWGEVSIADLSWDGEYESQTHACEGHYEIGMSSKGKYIPEPLTNRQTHETV